MQSISLHARNSRFFRRMQISRNLDTLINIACTYIFTHTLLSFLLLLSLSLRESYKHTHANAKLLSSPAKWGNRQIFYKLISLLPRNVTVSVIPFNLKARSPWIAFLTEPSTSPHHKAVSVFFVVRPAASKSLPPPLVVIHISLPYLGKKVE